MHVKIWGARGSIPVSGKDYIRYGGDTTCIEIETENGETIIFDAGTGIRSLGNKLLKEGRKKFHFLISHAHWDHLMGFPFFKPLYLKRSIINFHGCTFAQESIKSFLAQTMRAPFFPVDLSEVSATLNFNEICRTEFTIAGLKCRSIPLNHPNKGYGFRLYEGSKSICLFPDNELSSSHPDAKEINAYSEFVKNADVLVHDAEYLPEEYEKFADGWGHSVYTDTVKMGINAGVKRLVLFHLNQDRTDDQVDKMTEKARQLIASSRSNMQCEYARTGLEFKI